MGMTEGTRPTRTESVWLRVDGIKKGKGVLLLYPDKLACVKVSGRTLVLGSHDLRPGRPGSALRPGLRRAGSRPSSGFSWAG